MGLFDFFKKTSHALKEKSNKKQVAQANNNTSAQNAKHSLLNKRYCPRCGYNLDLLEPAQIMVNEEDGEEYCDICIKNLKLEKEYVVRVGTTITLKNRTICTPSMGGYPLNEHERITVCENGYLVATTTRDEKGDVTYSEEFIEGGFFTKSSMSEISKKLGLHDIQSNSKLLKIIEYDKIISGQSL